MSLSRHCFIGRLTKDIEGRDIQVQGEATRVANFTVACDGDGRNTESDFYNVVVWRQLATTCEQFIGKGRLVYVEGRPRTRSYENNQGQKVYVTEVIADKVQFLDRADNHIAGQEAPAQEPATNRPPF